MFRFCEAEHAYYDDLGRRVPNITNMLQRTGWVDPTWYTQASRDRGEAVHALTAALDLDALDLDTCESPYRPWLLAYAHSRAIVRPSWSHVEVAFMHEHLRFAGRPDRVGEVYGAIGVVDLKSGAEHRAHQVQTALQAILVAPEVGLRPELIHRYAWYLFAAKPGRWGFRLVRHTRVQDYADAREVIRQCVA